MTGPGRGSAQASGLGEVRSHCGSQHLHMGRFQDVHVFARDAFDEQSWHQRAPAVGGCGRCVVACLEDWAKSKEPPESFELLVANGMVEMTGEQLVLTYPDKFTPEAVAGATARLATFRTRICATSGNFHTFLAEGDQFTIGSISGLQLVDSTLDLAASRFGWRDGAEAE